MAEYKIPLFDLNFGQEEIDAVVSVLNSKWISSGPKCAEFETLFAKMLNVNHAVALANCTVALHLALKLIDIQPGDEVIVPSLTFAATANSILYMGAVPVFCDIYSPSDLNLNADRLESLITPKTKAIICVHFAGFPCDMEKILALANKHNLKVVEDACHGPLSEYKGQKLGTFGDVGCFSFFSNKNISTGEGGMLVTNHEAYSDRARLLRSHGMTSMSYDRAKGHNTSYDVVELGYNYRMDDIHAAIGIQQIQKLQQDLEKRERIRKMYEEGLQSVNGIEIPFLNNKYFVSNYIMPVVLNDSDAQNRDLIRQQLAKDGIQTSVHYPPVHRFSQYSEFRSDLPVTEKVADSEITLPMYGNLDEEKVAFICKSLSKAMSEI